MANLTRLLVMLDCASLDTNALDAAQALATNKRVSDQTELTGLYVEDEDVLRAARIPGVTEIVLASPRGPTLCALSEDRLGREYAGQARAAQLALEEYASKRRFRYAFQRVRGRMMERLLDAARHSDLVVVYRSTHAPGLRTRLASQFEPLLRARHSVLFVNEPWASGKRIAVLVDPAAEQSGKVTETARQFAAAEGLELVALELAADRIRTHDPASHGADRIRYLASWNEEEIVAACTEEEARLLVAPDIASVNFHNLLLRLADRLACSLFKIA